MKLLFLYTELSSYTLACFNELINHNFELCVVHYPINKEAPFVLNINPKIKTIIKSTRSLNSIIELLDSFKPSLIFCSGWKDKDYLKVSRIFKNRGGVSILCMDNKWSNSPKKYLAKFLSPFFLNPCFNFIWVPGLKQKEYALKLGFSDENIFLDFYTADTKFFENIYIEKNIIKIEKFPKRFIYIGRYYDFKGLTDLWKAFEQFSSRFADWELWCIGTGDLEPYIHPKIKHFGFLQPEQLRKTLQDTGVFVLPSRFEPWGVVVHEMAAAGFPMILSDEVGAAEAFLKPNVNGYIFKAKNIESCYQSLCKIAEQSYESLVQMSKTSLSLSRKNSTKMWVDRIIQIHNKFINEK